MRDLSVLKERVERAERQLKATYVARERECDALMRTWQQIRDRFESQEAEIARIRAECERLQEANDELTALVDVLLKSVDGNLHDATSEAVPQINALAQRMVSSEPVPKLAPAPPRREAPSPAAPDAKRNGTTAPHFVNAPPVVPPPIEELAELLAPAAGSVEDIAYGRTDDPPAPRNGHATDPWDRSGEDTVLAPDPEAEEILLTEPLDDTPEEADEMAESPGIRGLLDRIETAVSDRLSGTVHPIEPPAPSAPEPAERPDPIDEGLDDVTRLRQEIDGLRARLAVG